MRIGDVLQHGLAAVTEARSLDGRDLEAATELVDDERGESLALDVLGDDEQRLRGLDDGLEDRQHGLERGELLLVQEDINVLQFSDHLVGVGDEVGREIAAVELHAFDDIEFALGGLGFLDGDDTLVANFLHRFCDHVTNRRLTIGGNSTNLTNFFGRLDLLRALLDVLDGDRDGHVDAALQVHRVHAGGHVLGTLADDRLGEHGGGGGAVAGQVVGLGSDLTDHLGAHVLELVLEFDLLGDRHAVLGGAGSAEALVDDDVAALGAERDLHRVGEDVDAAQHALTSFTAEADFFSSHVCLPFTD